MSNLKDKPYLFQKGNKAAEKWTEEKALNFGQEMLQWMLTADENIFFEEFIFMVAPFLDDYENITINVDTPAYLSKKFKSFFELQEKSRKLQELKLKKFGSFDKLNVSMAKFLLSAEHGLSEKSRTEVEHVNVPIFDIKTKKKK